MQKLWIKTIVIKLLLNTSSHNEITGNSVFFCFWKKLVLCIEHNIILTLSLVKCYFQFEQINDRLDFKLNLHLHPCIIYMFFIQSIWILKELIITKPKDWKVLCKFQGKPNRPENIQNKDDVGIFIWLSECTFLIPDSAKQKESRKNKVFDIRKAL